jgi:hypothetical protein
MPDLCVSSFFTEIRVTSVNLNDKITIIFGLYVVPVNCKLTFQFPSVVRVQTK